MSVLAPNPAWHILLSIMCNTMLSGEPVYALGVHFIYDLEVSAKKNFFDKLGSLKKTLNMWS